MLLTSDAKFLGQKLTHSKFSVDVAYYLNSLIALVTNSLSLWCSVYWSVSFLKVETLSSFSDVFKHVDIGRVFGNWTFSLWNWWLFVEIYSTNSQINRVALAWRIYGGESENLGLIVFHLPANVVTLDKLTNLFWVPNIYFT